MIYEIAGHTETGPVRQRNEDHLLIGGWVRNRGWMALTLSADDELIQDRGLPLAVADGMGGIAGGATASRLALEQLSASLARTTPPGGSASLLAADLQAAIQQANAALHAAQAQDAGLAGMGTTLSAVLLTASGYWVLHVGDSRVLRIRNGFVRFLTRDDNLAEQLYRAGVDPEVADANPQAKALVSWLGADRMQAAVTTGPALEPGDQLVICSDGLHGFLPEDRIIQLLADPDRPLPDTVAKLVAAAIAAGSTDNISLIVLRVRERPEQSAEPLPDQVAPESGTGESQ